MKHIASIILISLILLNGCSQLPNNLSPEKAQELETTIEQNLAKLDTLESEDEKAVALFEIARSYSLLGKTKKSVNYYEKQLKINPEDYAALNNIISQYIELEDYENALKHFNEFYRLYGTNTKVNQNVVAKGINLLLKVENFDGAIQLITEYAREYQSPETTHFITRYYDKIQRFKDASTNQ